jgi:DNA-binding NtrC family response regulator
VPLQEFAREHVGELPPETPAEPSADSTGDLWRLRKHARDRAALELEKKLVADALERCQGNIAKAAREVGVSRVQFYRLLDRHGLRRPAKAKG